MLWQLLEEVGFRLALRMKQGLQHLLSVLIAMEELSWHFVVNDEAKPVISDILDFGDMNKHGSPHDNGSSRPCHRRHQRKTNSIRLRL